MSCDRRHKPDSLPHQELVGATRLYQFIPNPPLLTPFEEAIEIAATQTKSACADLVIMPFAEGKWQMRMSLKALDPQDWIKIDVIDAGVVGQS
jgi:hypothetical protein